MATETIEKTEDSQTAQTDDASKEALDISSEFDRKIDDDQQPQDSQHSSDENKDKSDTEDKSDGGTGKDTDETSGDDKDKQAISDELIARAAEADIDQTQAKSFSSPEDLERTLTILEKVKAKPADDKDTGGEKEDADKVKTFEVKLDEELYDPEIVKAVKGMNEHYASAVGTLQSQLAETQQQLKELQDFNANQQTITFETQFDSMIDGLGDEFKELLGEGPGSKLDANSAQFKNREKIIEEMSDFVAARQNRGKPIPAQAEIFDRAVKVVFSDKANSLAAKRTRSSVKKRSGQIIENSTGGKGKTLTAEQEALKVSSDFDKKLDSEGF